MELANVVIKFSAEGEKTVVNDLKTIQSNTAKTNTLLKQMQRTLASIHGTGLAALQKQADLTTSSTQKLQKEIKKTGTGIRNLIPHVAAVTLSYMAMRRAVNAVTEAIKAGADFEQQMAIVGGIVRATTEDFEMLTAAAREAGETTVWTATESANALRFLGMAGFSAAESIEALGGVLNLALIGELDLSRATDIATDTLRAFGLEAKELDRVVDVMVGTITRSNTNIESMGQALKYVAPVAAKLGYTVEETSAMIGILSQSGIKAGIAGRALRMSFLKSIDAGKALGLETHNLIEILKELESRNLGATKLTATLKEMFGLRATPALLTLISGIEQLETFTTTLENAKGETDEFIERLDTVDVAFRKLKSVITDVAIEIFLEYADELKQTLKDLANTVRNNKDEIKELFDAMATGGKIIKDSVIGPLKIFATIIKSINDLGALAGVTNLVGELAKALLTVAVPLTKINAVLNEISTAGDKTAGWIQSIFDYIYGGEGIDVGLIEQLAEKLMDEADKAVRKASAGEFYNPFEAMFEDTQVKEILGKAEEFNKDLAATSENWKQMRLKQLEDEGEEAYKLREKTNKKALADAENFQESLAKLDRSYSQKAADLLDQFTNGPYKEYILEQANLTFAAEAEKLNYVESGSKEALEIIKRGQQLALAIIKDGLKKQKKEWDSLYKFRRENENELQAQYEEETITAEAEKSTYEWMEKDKKATEQLFRDKLQAHKTYLEWVKGTYSPEYIAVSEEILRLEADQLAKKLNDLGIEADAEKLYTQMQIQEDMKRLEAKATYYDGIKGMEAQAYQARLAAAALAQKLDTIKFGDPTAAAKKFTQAIKKPFDDLIKDIKASFSEDLFGDSAENSLHNMIKAFSDLSEMYEKQSEPMQKLSTLQTAVTESRQEYNELLQDTEAQESDIDYWSNISKLQEEIEIGNQKITEGQLESIAAQAGAYSQFFGQVKQMFEEGSREYEAFAMAEKITGIANILLKAATAIINAGASGDGYTAVARMAAVAAAVGAVLSQVGLSISGPGGGGGTEPADYTPGSTLYGAETGAVSESLANSFEILNDINLEQFGKLIDIHRELQKLNSNITGLVRSIVKGGNVDELAVPGEIESPMGGTFAKLLNNFSTIGATVLMGPIAGLIQKVFGGLFEGILESIGSFLFGGDVDFEVLESGLQHFGTSVTAMSELVDGMKELNIRTYLWYEQQTSGGLFGDDDAQRKTIYGDRLDDVSRLVTGVIKGIGETMLSLAPLLGYGEETIKKIKEYVVNLGTIDLKNLNAEQIGEALNAWFSNFADVMAGDIFGELLTKYQQAGEGLFETAIRLAVETETVLEILDLTGTAFEGTRLEAVHFSQAIIELAGDLDGLMESAQSYFDAYLSEAEKLVWLSDNLTDAFKAIGIAMPATRDEFKALISGLDLTTEEGADLYIMLLNIAGATDEYYDALEAANERIIDLQRKILGTEDSGAISDIASRYGLQASWIDEEWVKTILEKFAHSTPEQIRAYAAAMGVTVEQLVSDIDTLRDIFSEAGDAAKATANDFANMIETIRQNIQAVQDQIDKTLFISQGGTDPEYYMSLMSQHKADAEYLIAQGDLAGAMQQLVTGSAYLTQWYNAAVAEATKAAQELVNARRDELNEQRSILQEQLSVAQAFGNLVDTIENAWLSIKYSAQNVSVPLQKAIASEEDYYTLKAKSGDSVEDAQKFISFASTFLDQQRAEYASGSRYVEAYNMVQADLAALKASATALSYDEAILAQLEAIEAELSDLEVVVNLSEINEQFANMVGILEGLMADIQSLELVLNIDWENYHPTMADALNDLMLLVETYGWDHEYTLNFLANVPLDMFTTLNDLAIAAGWIADQSGGWNSTATIAFIKNIAGNWEFENINEILAAAGYLAQVGGGWGADVVVNFIATLMDRFNVPLSDLPYWLDRMGLDDAESMQFYIKYFTSLLDPNQDPITQIDTWLASLGINNEDINRNLRVNLLYNFVASGNMDISGLADWAFAEIAGVSSLPVGDAQKKNVLRTMQDLVAMFGGRNAYGVGWNVSTYSPVAKVNGWSDANAAGLAMFGVYDRNLGYTSWAEGGIATQPTWGVYGEAGPEAFLRLAENRYVPIPDLGAIQSGSVQPIEISLSLELDGKPLDAKIRVVAKSESETHRVNLIRRGTQNSPERQPV